MTTSVYGAMAEVMLNGRRAATRQVFRVRAAKHQWGWYNRVEFAFLNDDGATIEVGTLPLGEFNKKAKRTGRWLFISSGKYCVAPETA